MLKCGANDAEILTHGHHILDAPYCALLKKAILRCLAVDRERRPPPRELLGIFYPEDGIVEALAAMDVGRGHPKPGDGRRDQVAGDEGV